MTHGSPCMPHKWSWWGPVVGSRCASATTPAIEASTAAPSAAFRRVMRVIVMCPFFAGKLKGDCEKRENRVRISVNSPEGGRTLLEAGCR